MTELDALKELQGQLQGQLSEILWTIRAIGCGVMAGFAASFGIQSLFFRRVRRLEERQARIEAWQTKHGPPLERLAFQQHVEDPGGALPVQRGGSREAPL